LAIQPDEVVECSLCDYIQKDDLKSLKNVGKLGRDKKNYLKNYVLKPKDNAWKYLDCSFSVSEEEFLCNLLGDIPIWKERKAQAARST